MQHGRESQAVFRMDSNLLTFILTSDLDELTFFCVYSFSNDILCMTSTRMPGERLSIRDNSAVGRFHGVSASNGHAIPEKQSDAKEKKENGCRRWLRKACPCCFRRQNSSYDVTGEVDGGLEGENETPSTPLPLTLDTNVDGKGLTFIRFMHI